MQGSHGQTLVMLLSSPVQVISVAMIQTQMLPMPHSRMQGLLDPNFQPFLHPELDLCRGDQEQLSVGRLSLVFSCRDDDTAMNEIEIIDYLDYCLAWPER